MTNVLEGAHRLNGAKVLNLGEPGEVKTQA